MQSTSESNRSSSSSSDGSRVDIIQPQMTRSGAIVRKRPKKKRNRNSEVFSRRVTCHDLGQGTCEGWLLKKSENKTLLSKSWIRMYFKLKEFVLYYYKDTLAEKATGVICLAGYTVQYSNKRKWAMTISHKGIGKKICIAAEKKSDWERWLEQLQLAAIVYTNTENVRNSQIFIDQFGDSPPVIDEYSGYHSESDEDDGGFTREEIIDKVATLSALRRTIEAKRRVLKELDKLLAQEITSESIKLWQKDHPDLLQGILTNLSGDIKRKCSISDEVERGNSSDTSPPPATRLSPSGRLQSGDLRGNGSSLSDEEDSKKRQERHKDIQGEKEQQERTESEISDTRL